MARRQLAHRSARGGDGIQAPRRTRSRLALSAAALAATVALVVYPVAAASRLGSLLGLVGATGALVLALALLFRGPVLVAPAFVLVGGEYAGWFLLRGGAVDTRAPLYGAGFLLAAELALSALERRASPYEAGLGARRVVSTVALGVLAVAAGVVVLAATSLPVGGGVGLEAVGVAAAVAAVALVGTLALRSLQARGSGPRGPR